MGDTFSRDSARRIAKEIRRLERTPRNRRRREHFRRFVPFNATRYLEAGGRLGLVGTSSYSFAEDDGANYVVSSGRDGYWGVSRVYYVPYLTDKIFLYNGTAWTQQTFDSTDANLTISDTGNHDVFAYWDTSDLTVYLESAAWASGAARSSMLKRLNGILVKDDEGSQPEGSRYTRRYLGTVRKDSGLQLCDYEEKRFVWNNDNRIRKSLRKTWGDTGGSTSLTERGRVEWISGASYPSALIVATMYAVSAVSNNALYESLLEAAENAVRISNGGGVMEYARAGVYYAGSPLELVMATSGAAQIGLRGLGHLAAVLKGRRISSTAPLGFSINGIIMGSVWC